MNLNCACGHPVADGYVCQSCAYRLERALGDVPALADELEVVLIRQARFGEHEGRRSAETPLPFNPTASEIGWVLQNTFSTWCRLIAEERGRTLPDRGTSASLACWLLAHVEWLRHHRAGPEAVDEMISAVNQVRRVIDRPPEKVYAGPCADCGGDMYGRVGAVTVECRPCGLEYDVAQMQDWMRKQVYGRNVTAREGAALLSRFGLEVTQGTIDKWHFRGRIANHGHDVEGRRLYLFDDLAALAAASQRPDTPSMVAS